MDTLFFSFSSMKLDDGNLNYLRHNKVAIRDNISSTTYRCQWLEYKDLYPPKTKTRAQGKLSRMNCALPSTPRPQLSPLA